MKPLDQYPVSFPFGSTAPPYNPSHPHRGNDRAAPIGTPIIVTGATIGFVGMTGLATGPHCHTQEWQGSKLNVRKPQNEFKPGTVVEVDRDGTSGDRSLGKYVTIQNADGWNTSYCHMNVTNAKVGDIIKQGGNMPYVDQAVLDDYEKWKKVGLVFANRREWPAMGGSQGNPDANANQINLVMDDLEKNKEQNLAKQDLQELPGPVFVKKG